MKKFLSVILTVVMLVSLVALAGCGEAQTLKFGFGVVSSYSDVTSATEEANGAGTVNTTAVAVLLDADGKIVDIDLDTAQLKAAWTAEGKIVATTEFRTKYERGTDYGMAAYGYDKNGDEKVLEWNEQADAFMATVIGKTLDEVKAYMAEDGYATGDLATAGCTIKVSEFISALEVAVNNAADSAATADATVQVGMSCSAYYENKDATAEANGSDELDCTAVGVALDKDGKIIVAATDASQGKFAFDATGASALAEDATITTKLALGDAYGMAAAINYGMDKNGDGKVLEWYDQAAAFNNALVGLTASEITGLQGEGNYGNADLQTAGCTITVNDFVAAAVKAATIG